MPTQTQLNIHLGLNPMPPVQRVAVVDIQLPGYMRRRISPRNASKDEDKLNTTTPGSLEKSAGKHGENTSADFTPVFGERLFLSLVWSLVLWQAVTIRAGQTT